MLTVLEEKYMTLVPGYLKRIAEGVEAMTQNATAPKKDVAPTFSGRKEYIDELNAVYRFHERAYNSVVDYLRNNGDIEPEMKIIFSFLCMEGQYAIQAVRLTDDGRDFYLEATRSDTEEVEGEEVQITWEEINHDMVIVEWLMEFVYPG